MNESDRLLHVARELTERVGGALEDVIPPDARRHLLNAQRELLTALFLIYEHQAGARRPPPAPTRRRSRATSAGSPDAKTSGHKKISID